MKKSRQTKRALIPSILAVIMCVAMLIGTTFAWFTDTASTSVNKIQAGKLDVALYYANGTKAGTTETNWENAEGKTLSFLRSDANSNLTQDDTILWEPGCTYDLPELKIVNNENLDLKYKILVTGINSSSADVKDLNSAITWTMELDDVDETLGTEHYLYAKDNIAEADKATKKSENIFTISGHMKKEAGNDYQGLSIDGIAITVYATQLNSEFDSIDNTYDQNALYPLMPSVNVTATKEATVDNNSALTTAVEMTASTIPAGTVLYKTHEKESGTDNKVVTTETSGTLKEEVKTTASSEKAMTISIDYTYVTTQADTTTTTTAVKGFSVPIEHTFPLSKGLKSVTVTHTDDEGKIENMTKAADAKAYAAGNFEGYYYDSNSGTLYIKSSTYSDFNVVINHGFVAAVNGQGYQSFGDAVAAANGGTVVLVDNLTKDITISSDLTLDLGGKTLTNASGDTITVESGATLTIRGSGTVDNITNGKAAIVNKQGGTVILNGGTYDRSAEAGRSKTDNGGNSYYTIQNFGTMTVNAGVTVKNNGGYSSMFTNGWYDGSKNTEQKEAKLTINGGTFNGGLNTVKNDDWGVLEIKGGTFTNTTQACIQNHNVATISGGTFNPSNAIAVGNCGKESCGVNETMDQHKLTISGGTFNGDIKGTPGTVTLSGDYTLTGDLVGNITLRKDDSGAYLIGSAAELRYFAQKVNTYAANTTFKLTADIDLGGEEWTPIAWTINHGGVFDGQEHTISNFTVNGEKDLGLFSDATGVTIKNLTVDKATVTGIGRVGAIVGRGICTHLDNCHVKNSAITANVYNNDDGDKAGALVGQLSAQMSASMTNCTVENCTVKAYRDLGGLIGHVQNKESDVKGNTVKNTTVIKDLSSGLPETATVGEIVGRQDETPNCTPFVLDTTKNTATNVTISTIPSATN